MGTGEDTEEGVNNEYVTTPSIGRPRIGIDINSEDTQDVSLTIPLEHWTTTDSLLLIPQIKSFIGDYPKNFFLQLESSRATSVQEILRKHITDDSHLPELHAEETDALISAFFLKGMRVDHVNGNLADCWHVHL